MRLFSLKKSISLLSLGMLIVGMFPASSVSADINRCPSWVGTSIHWQNTITYHLNSAFCIQDHNNGRLEWQGDGNLVWYLGGTPIWDSKTANRGSTLNFQLDGNMVIRNAGGTSIWGTNTMPGTEWHPGMRASGSTYFTTELGYGSKSDQHFYDSRQVTAGGQYIYFLLTHNSVKPV